MVGPGIEMVGVGFLLLILLPASGGFLHVVNDIGGSEDS